MSFHDNVPLQVNITIVGAKDLPKTDRLSAIDPYIKILATGGSHEKTKVIDDNANPLWDSEHTLILPYSPSANAMSTILFELWDENSVSKDEKVGVAEFQVHPSHLQNPSLIEIPFKMLKDKHAKHNSVMTFRFGEYAYSCKGLYSIIKNIYPHAMFHDHGLGRLYIPLSVPHLILGVEYEKRCADIKLYVTDHADKSFVDMVRVHHQNSQVRRRKVDKPANVYQTVTFFEEIKMNDVPFSQLSEPGRVLFFVFQKQLLSSVNLDTVVTSHGWKGMLNFSQAAAMLKDVELDRKEEEIFMKRDQSLIVVDFDKDNVDMKCFVLDSPENTDIAYDFAYKGSDVKKTSEIFSPSKPLLNGKYLAQRKLELDDVPFGTPFNHMEWFKYKVTNPVQISFFDVVRVHPF